jgi:fatty acid desaturase
MNFIVMLFQIAGWFLTLQIMHYEFHILLKVALVFVFCLMMQGVFSLMHECFHNHGHRNKNINGFMGWLLSTIFGTSFTLFHRNHEGHHVRNRTRPEVVDYIYPDESKFKKVVLYYVGILGGIWLMSFLGSLLLLFVPYRATRFLARSEKDNTYSSAFNDFSPKDWTLLKLEVILSIATWALLIWAFSWKASVLIPLYVAFAFSWSSLQWIYHVRTPLHPVEGAYNLRLPNWIRLLFLNFNYNLSHHRDPRKPWQRLFSESSQTETQPLWYRYICIFRPPEEFPNDPHSLKKTYF